MMVRLPTHIYASLGLNELSDFASDHRVALVVHRNLYPTRPVSDPHFRLRRWRAALGPLMLTVPIETKLIDYNLRNNNHFAEERDLENIP